MMGLRLADGRIARYPSHDGTGLAVEPDAPQPDVTWIDCTERFGLEVALALQNQAALAEIDNVTADRPHEPREKDTSP